MISPRIRSDDNTGTATLSNAFQKGSLHVLDRWGRYGT